MTHLAAKADMWVPIQPATDAALALSMMYVMVDEDAINKPFMKAHTCAPFLVREDTGKFFAYERSRCGADGHRGGAWAGFRRVEREQRRVCRQERDGSEDDRSPAVLDADGSIVAVDDASDPQISGTYDFEGVKCRTAYDLLRDDIMEYPPEKAAEICDIPADTIVELAHIALDGPCIHRLVGL